MKEKSLSKHRSKVKIINKEILQLLHKRFFITHKMGVIKKKEGTRIRRKDIEKEMVRQMLKENRKRLDERFLKKLYSLIFRYSRKEQKETKRGK